MKSDDEAGAKLEVISSQATGKPAADAFGKIVRDRPVDEAAAELAKKRLMPRPPGKKLTFDEMLEWFKLLTPEMWSHIVIYLYRDKPRILRQLQNPQNPKFIDCIGHPFDLDYIIQNHGGGAYNIMACDTEAKLHSEANRLFIVDFEVNMTQHEPKLNYEELDVNHKGNMAYVQLLQHRGILDNKGQVMTTPAQASQAASADVVGKVLDFATKMNADSQAALRSKLDPGEDSLSKSIGSILLEKMKQDDPTKNLTSLVAVIKEVMNTNQPPDTAAQLSGLLSVIKEVLASSKPPDGSTQLLEKVMQMQNEHNKTVLSLFEKLTAARANPEGTAPAMEQLEQVLSIAERISGMRGSAGRRSGWDVGLDYAKEIGVPLLQTIGNLVSLRMNGRPAPPIPMPAATAGSAAPTAAFDPYANPEATRALGQSLSAAQPAPPQNPPAAPSAAPNELAALIQNYGGLLVQHLNVGTPGYVFGDYITGLMGNGMHAQVVAPGEDALVQALLTTPETAVYGEARLRKFVNEFIHYQEFLDAEEAEDNGDDEPPPMPAPRVPATATIDTTKLYRPPAARGTH